MEPAFSPAFAALRRASAEPSAHFQALGSVCGTAPMAACKEDRHCLAAAYSVNLNQC
jgi:hypothetical protein